MRAWCVVVPRNRGEEMRRSLRDRGELVEHLKIREERGSLLLPTIGRLEIGLPVRQADFEPGYAPVRSYRELVRVPEDLRVSLPRAFDAIGDIAVLKIPEELEAHREEIGRAILAWDRKLRVVAQDRGVAGVRRIRRIEIIAGEDRTTTVHVEFGLRYRVDVARAYFSPRLGTERKRVADLVTSGETVLDPFAGVGPYAILVAIRSPAARVLAADANPDAVALLRANVAANRASRVEVREGDAREVLRTVGPVDRVILDLPHAAMDFVPDALRALRPRGTLHVYGIVEEAEREDRVQEIRSLGAREEWRATTIRVHDVRAYSPTQHHVAFDVTVGPA
ncbi:MAG TPA: class I SAM-dependent methyltransferase family protein [Thermoplasmata archaeon]|nr:class I SAM-dependent methyltransferase family protein [Thermoplasmata archaeon]